MNKNLQWSAFVLAGLFLFGCNHPKMFELKKTSIDKENASAIAGTWQCYYPAHWEITFDNDGTLKKILHNTSVEFVVAEGGKAMNGPNNEEAVFLLGPCNVKSRGDSLNVTVNIEYFKMELPQGTLEGWIKDTLIGKLSADKNEWNVKWYCYSRIKVAETGKWSDEPNIKDINQHPIELIFKKAQENQ